MKRLIIFFFLSLSVHAWAGSKLDSLQNVYLHTKSDTQKVNLLLYQIAPKLQKSNPDSAVKSYLLSIKMCLSGAKKATTDSLRFFYIYNLLNGFNRLSNFYKNILNKRMVLSINEIVYKLAKRINAMYPHKLEPYIFMGDYYTFLGSINADTNKVLAIKNYTIAYKYFEFVYKFDTLSTESINGLIMVNNEIASLYLNHGDYSLAYKHFYNALRIKEKEIFYTNRKDNNSIKILSSLYTNIANCQILTKDYDEALEHLNKSIYLKKQIADSSGIYQVKGLIGTVYLQKTQYKEALPYLLESVNYFERKQKTTLLAKMYNNLAITYANLKEFEKSINYYQKAMFINEKLNKIQSICILHLNIGQNYIKLSGSKLQNKNELLNKAIYHLKIAEDMSIKHQIPSVQDNLYDAFQTIYSKQGDFKKAYHYAKLLQGLKDSLYSEQKTKAVAEAKVQYETEKKQLMIDKLNKENELKQVKLEKAEEIERRQRTLLISAVIIILIVSVSLFSISKMYIQIRKTNVILKEQKAELIVKNDLLTKANDEIRNQKEEIERQRDIVISQKNHIEHIHANLKESIEYARYIQRAVIRPLETIIEPAVPNRFEYYVIYRPKDIVSGDFYWAHYVNNYLIIAVADCTGHGVPGALMSMLGMSLLHEIVRKKEITSTAHALEILRKEIIFALQQKGIRGEQKDGMDIGLVAINCQTLEMQFSGANNNLVLLPEQSNEPIEIKGDKMPVAIYEKMEKYSLHQLQLNKGDIFYLSTDGYKDQFGGHEGKKFLQKRFLAIIQLYRHLSLKEQGIMLEMNLDQWMHGETYNYQQIDDITVLGMKVL